MKARKIFSLLICVAMLISVCSISYADVDARTTEPMSQPILSMMGKSVSNAFVDDVAKLGISITENSKIEIVPVKSTLSTRAQTDSNATALIVTNTIDDVTSKDVALMINDDGSINSVTPNMLSIATRGSESAQFPPKSWDGRYIITGTATYTNPKGEYYRPTKVSFTYKKYETCTVNSIKVQYICDGFEYTYPGYESISDNNIEWVISKSATSPSEGKSYSNPDRPYSSSKVIYTGSGSPSVGHFLTFTPTVNGEKTSYTVRLK